MHELSRRFCGGDHLDDEAEALRLRHRLHAWPELGFQETGTAALVAEFLAGQGFTVTQGLAGTGVVAELRRGTAQRRLLLRADMDALPITETPGKPYVSRCHGVMHACGHDGHMAMLLGAARRIARDGQFDGILTLIFQPGEEGHGGARRILEDGLLDRFPGAAIFGLHNMPGLPSGTFGFCEGAALASSDRATIVLRGSGGHGAYPHRTEDPVVAAASLVLAIQSIVARQTDAQKAAVITVGALQAGEAANVIPDSARLELSIRTLDPGIRGRIETRLERLARGHAEQFDLTLDYTYRREYPVLVNHATPLAEALATAATIGPVTRVPPQMGSEDFAEFLALMPGAFLFLGNDGPDDPSPMIHQPDFDFNDASLAPGIAFWTALVENQLAPGSA